MNSSFRWGFMYRESGRGSIVVVVVFGRCRIWICDAAMDFGRVVAGEVFGSGIEDPEKGS